MTREMGIKKLKTSVSIEDSKRGTGVERGKLVPYIEELIEHKYSPFHTIPYVTRPTGQGIVCYSGTVRKPAHSMVLEAAAALP